MTCCSVISSGVGEQTKNMHFNVVVITLMSSLERMRQQLAKRKYISALSRFQRAACVFTGLWTLAVNGDKMRLKRDEASEESESRKEKTKKRSDMTTKALRQKTFC